MYRDRGIGRQALVRRPGSIDPGALTPGAQAGGSVRYEHLTLAPEMAVNEIAELKAIRWHDALTAALTASGRTSAELAATPKGAEWKVAVARELRETVAPPFVGWPST
jgi:hypothetical protein